MISKITPTREEFIQKAQEGNLIPVYCEIIADMDTPVSVFRKIDKGPYSFLLESVSGGEHVARYSFMGKDPHLVITKKAGQIHRVVPGSAGQGSVQCGQDADLLEQIKQELSQYRPVVDPALPRFTGGIVGYLGYDMVGSFEKIPCSQPDQLGVADAVFMVTDTVLIFDHVRHILTVLSNALVKDDPNQAYDQAVATVKGVLEEIKVRDEKEVLLPEVLPQSSESVLESNFSKEAFEGAVTKAKDYIRKGDIIQVVLSQRLQTEFDQDPFNLYRALRHINPSPYMYYLNLGDFRMIGSSPEILVRVEGKTVEVRPIAGTRPRGQTEEEDKALEKELLADEKERAEHVMLVDLGRNDIGRVCTTGSVKVDELMVIERYSHVMHIVSNVVGILRDDKNIYDVIRATFPAGTVSGAPKIRAMEIIDELETLKRGPYAGCVGYFSFGGNLDSCITIRTMFLKDKRLYLQAGAGIVADSDPEKEYYETLSKAKALLKAVELSRQM